MTQRPRRLRTAFALLCAALAVALALLWWRSGTNVDTLAWTTARPDPTVAANEFPARWNMLGGMKYDGAVRTFAVISDAGQIQFERNLYLRRAPSTIGLFGGDVVIPEPSTPIAPHPFADEPSLLCRYGRSLPFAPKPMRFAGFDTTEIDAATYFESGIPGKDWDWRGRCVAVPHWTPIAVLLAPATWMLLGHLRRRRRAGAGLCGTCGYDLRASPDRCPECGTAAASAVAAPAA
jgi:hypothetical protein